MHQFMCEHAPRLGPQLASRHMNASVVLAPAPFRCSRALEIGLAALNDRHQLLIRTAAKLERDSRVLLIEDAEHRACLLLIHVSAFIAKHYTIAHHAFRALVGSL